MDAVVFTAEIKSRLQLWSKNEKAANIGGQQTMPKMLHICPGSIPTHWQLNDLVCGGWGGEGGAYFCILRWRWVLSSLNFYLQEKKIKTSKWKQEMQKCLLTSRRCKWTRSRSSLSCGGRWHGRRSQPRRGLHIHRWVWHRGVLLSPIWRTPPWTGYFIP